MSKIENNKASENSSLSSSDVKGSPFRSIKNNKSIKKFFKHKKAVFGLSIVILLILAVVILPLVMELDPYTTDKAAGFNKAPSPGHILGTDEVGRDLFARLLYGGRISLFVGITSTIISVLIGVPLGLLAGYYRGKVEVIIMRTADSFMSMPSMVLILVLVAVFGPSIFTVTVVIGVLGWTTIAKLIYGNVLSIREKEFIEAARAIGMKDYEIIIKEVLPNAIPPVWADLSFRVAGAILTESSLSFLGMGVQTPQASWGNIIFAAQNLLVLTARPWVWIPPGLCIVCVIVGFNFIGEGVRYALDPKTK